MNVSDPFAVVTVRGDNENNKPRVIGQTDVYVVSILKQIVFLCVDFQFPNSKRLTKAYLHFFLVSLFFVCPITAYLTI
jgi:hypothetical protein